MRRWFLLLALSWAPSVSADEPIRFQAAVEVWPQFEQQLGDGSLPVEVYRVAALVPAGRDFSLAPSVSVRRDFLIVGGGVSIDLHRSEQRTWRLTLAGEQVFPFSETKRLFERMNEGSIGFTDRSGLTATIGQTFGLQDGRVGLLVQYQLRVMFRGGVLSTLEGMDDPVSSTSAFWMHAIGAGLEFDFGSR